jgi:hypothetical protein
LDDAGFSLIVLTTVGNVTHSHCEALRQLCVTEPGQPPVPLFLIMDQDVLDFSAKLIFKKIKVQPIIVALKPGFGNAFVGSRSWSPFAMKALTRMARSDSHFLTTSCPPGDAQDRWMTMQDVSE